MGSSYTNYHLLSAIGNIKLLLRQMLTPQLDSQEDTDA